MAWCDNGTVYLRINETESEGASLGGTMWDSTTYCEIGAQRGSGSYWSGRIGPVALWRSNVGEGGCLTSQQRNWLWNAGRGMRYNWLTE